MSSDVDERAVPRGPYLSNRQAAQLLGVHPVTLACWRQKGRGPKWSKLGDAQNAPVRYRKSDVDAWIRQWGASVRGAA